LSVRHLGNYIPTLSGNQFTRTTLNSVAAKNLGCVGGDTENFPGEN